MRTIVQVLQCPEWVARRSARQTYVACRGYWTDISNLERELRTWMAKNAADQDRLPTNRELRASGANQLCNAIEYHGGFNAVAQKLG